MLRMILSGTLCLATAIACVYQAHAGVSSSQLVQGSLAPGGILAVGNGAQFGEINPNRDLTAKIRVTAEADGVAGRIKSVESWLALRNLDWEGGYFHAKEGGYKKEYPFGTRNRTFDGTVSVRVPAAQLKQWMTLQCNTLVQRLRQQGLTDRQIWGQDRPIRIRADAGHQISFAEITRRVDEIQPKNNNPNVILTCQKFATETPPRRVDRVETARLEHSTVATPSGTCTLNLNYAVRTNHPHAVVKFRLKDDKGRSSEVKTLTTNEIKIAAGSVSYNIPDNVGAETGKIRMHGVSPEFLSNQIEYRVVCTSAPGGLSPGQGSGGQASQPPTGMDPAVRERLRRTTPPEGRQRIGNGIQSRGIDSLPAPVIPDPEPPALPSR